jgi:hypothetical protein
VQDEIGSGERLFDGVGDDLRGLELVRTVATPGVTHLKFSRYGEERTDGCRIVDEGEDRS